MSATPYMPLWVADFTNKTQGLDTRETGAYLLLLMAMWSNGGALPENHRQLQRIARAGREWPAVWEGIKRFFTIEDGVITQSRLTEEYKKATAKVEARRQSGALGGKAKALKEKAATLANATVLPCQSEPETEVSKREAKASLVTAPPKRVRQVHDDTPEFCAFWNAYPRKEAKGEARTAFAKAILKADPAIIIAAASRVEHKGQYNKLPATWLNKECWLDQETRHEPDRSQQPRRPGGGQSILDAAARAGARFRTPGGDSGGAGCDDRSEPGMDFGPRGRPPLALLAS